MAAIDPAAKMNCDILRAKPRKVPGVPGKSFIFLSKIKEILRFLMAKDEQPSSDLSQKCRKTSPLNQKAKPSTSTTNSKTQQKHENKAKEMETQKGKEDKFGDAEGNWNLG